MSSSENNQTTNSDPPTGPATSDYYLFPPATSTLSSRTSENNNGPRQQGGEQILSPVTFREEAGLHNDSSERLLFDEEELTSIMTPSVTTRILPVTDETDEETEQHQRGDEETTTEHNNNSGGGALSSPLLTPRFSLRQRRRLRGGLLYSPLNGLNFLNVVTYAAHLFVSYGIGIWGLDGLVDTRWKILTKYETLVTPAHWAYYLWCPILVLEGIFTLAQLTPHYRSRPVIQDGTGFYFFYTFLIQTAWTFFFSFQLFIGSFVAVVAALVSLLSLLVSQHKSLLTVRRPTSRLEYFLFRFPFYLHAGWMTVMAVDHLCLLVRKYAPDHVGMQLAVDMFALAILLAVATTALSLRTPGPFWPQQDFVIPAVVIWSYLGIAHRLTEPSPLILEVYGDVIVNAVCWASLFMACTVVGCMIPCIVVWIAREFCVIGLVELDE